VRQPSGAVHRVECRWLALMGQKPEFSGTARISVKTGSWPGY